MKIEKKPGRLPIKMWLDDLDDNAMAQARNLAELPFAFKHIAIMPDAHMPDAHMGYGMPIGGVLATEGVVIPNAVGVDIGCGMLAMKTDIRGLFHWDVETIIELIREKIPVGFKSHSKNQLGMPQRPAKGTIVNQQWSKASKSLGTLGGGNHFIELQLDEEGYLWVMIHSGSRNLGKQVADYYNAVAKSLNTRWCSSIPAGHDLAFLPLETHAGTAYIEEMEFCVEYALANRKLMMERVRESLSEAIEEVCFEDPINIAHNYARMENHFGCNVMVHRKGATSARLDEVGIIPGSQGTSSYIVRGLGNPESFTSCSHGAGRTMGRKQATRELDLEGQQAILDRQGIVHSIRTVKDLDEAPGAYKDIAVVMWNQKDLVGIIHQLKPIAVVKG